MRQLRRPAAIAAAALLLALPVLSAGPARADSGSGLGGWNVSADGNVIDVLVDNTTGLAGVHPVTEADFPEAESQFATGPFGSGLASVFWPGNALGDFGSISGELGIPSQLQPLLSKVNDPVKASVQYPAGPASSSYPAGAPKGAFDMNATAGSTGVTSTADIAGGGAPGVLGFAAAKGTSSSSADSTARAAASSDLSDVSLLGGLIRIGSIQSTATAQSDGKTGSGSASTHVTGVTVLGQPASIGSDGLILPDVAKTLNPVLGPVVQDLVSQVVSALGVQITEFPSSKTQDGAGYSTTSGGLSIKLDFPPSAASLLEQLGAAIAPLFPAQAAIIPTLPGLLQGMSITITLGRATASATASPPFSDSFSPLPASGPDAGSGTGAAIPSYPSGGATGAATGSVGSALPVGSATPTLATPAGTAPSSAPSSAPARPSVAAPGPPTALISLSSPLTAGVVVLGLLVALAVGYGLWRLARLLLVADAGPACPLGQDRP